MDWREIVGQIIGFGVPAILGILLAKYYFKKKPVITEDGKILFRQPAFYKYLGIVCFLGFGFLTVMLTLEGFQGFEFLLILFCVGMSLGGLYLLKETIFEKVIVDKERNIIYKNFKKETSANLDQLEQVKLNPYWGTMNLYFKDNKKIPFSIQSVGRRYFYQILISEYKHTITPKAMKYIEKELKGELLPML